MRFESTAILTTMALLLTACAPTVAVVTTQKVPDDADVPFRKVLVITMFDSFDARRYLEDEIVVALGVSIGGHPHHRIGDRYQDLKEMGHDVDNPAGV